VFDSIVTTSKLAELEDIIQRGKQSFVEVSNALAQIMEEQLYREKGFGSFAEYCETVWGFKKTYAYQHVQSAEVVKGLPAPVSAIAENFNSGQVRALISVPKEQRETVIKKAVAKSKSAGRKLTAKDISSAAQPEPEPEEPARVQSYTPEPITTVVIVTPNVEAQPEPNFKRKFASGTHSEKSATRWWWTSATPEKRGQFVRLLLTSSRPVQVEDKARFKQQLDYWLEHYVSETKGERHE
jgi:hypothetical protein